MDANKVRELISDLERDIESKVKAISALKSLLATEHGGKVTPPPDTTQLFQVSQEEPSVSGSYIDLAVEAIERSPNQFLGMKDMVDFIRKMKGNPKIERRSVEATIARHMKAKGPVARLVKVRPGVYALRRYPRTEPAA